MILRAQPRPPLLLIRPGATDFDDQGRIKGSLDMPMSDLGRRQVSDMADELMSFQPQIIYTAPCESAMQTAEQLAQRLRASGREVRIKTIDDFRNVDHGLWHGKLIDELRRNHPRLYRHGIDAPGEVVPPGGESILKAKHRAMKALTKIVKKSGKNVIAVVIPDPLGEIVRALLSGQGEVTNLWNFEVDRAHWDLIPA